MHDAVSPIPWTTLPEWLATHPLLDAAGGPVAPLAFVELPRAPIGTDDHVLQAVRAQGAPRVLVGVAAGGAGEACMRAAMAMSCSLSVFAHSSRAIVQVGDLSAACAAIAAQVGACPRAALVLADLLAVKSEADEGLRDALVRESFAYSMLRSGPEFARWLRRRPRPPAMRAPGSPLQVRREGDRLVLVLDDPARRNAFGAAMRDALLAALEVALADERLAVDLCGNGPSFSSGGDLDEFGLAANPVDAHLVRLEASVGWRMARCAARTTVRVHGACIGAGLETAAFARQVVARPDAFFRLPELAMGLIPGAGGTVSVPRRIGRWRAAWMVLGGCQVDAATALAWGLVDRVSPA
ncbi:MAG: enoyl-CoA hydratase/isomerase family protein [Lautropia sp.]